MNNIELIKAAFAKWLEGEYGVGGKGTEDQMVVVPDTANEFIAACREYRKVSHDAMGAYEVTLITESQRQKGEPRCDLYILDCGEYRISYHYS